MISDNIPIFNEYRPPNTITQHYLQLCNIYEAVTEFGAVITLNQALLLKEYERGLIITLSKILERLYKESVPYNKPVSFFTNWVISEKDINKYDIDDGDITCFNTYQRELQLIEKIKLLAGGCNREII